MPLLAGLKPAAKLNVKTAMHKRKMWNVDGTQAFAASSFDYSITVEFFRQKYKTSKHFIEVSVGS